MNRHQKTVILAPRPCPFTPAPSYWSLVIFGVWDGPWGYAGHAQRVTFGSCVMSPWVRQHHCHPTSSSKVLPHPRLGAGPGSGAAVDKGVGRAPGLIPTLPSSSLCCFRLLRDQGQGPPQQEGETGVGGGRRRGGLPGPGSSMPLKCPLPRQMSKRWIPLP